MPGTIKLQSTVLWSCQLHAPLQTLGPAYGICYRSNSGTGQKTNGQSLFFFWVGADAQVGHGGRLSQQPPQQSIMDTTKDHVSRVWGSCCSPSIIHSSLFRFLACSRLYMPMNALLLMRSTSVPHFERVGEYCFIIALHRNYRSSHIVIASHLLSAFLKLS